MIMIVLDSTVKSLEIILAGSVTTNQLPYVLSYVDLLSTDQSVSSVGSNDGVTNNGTAVSVLAAPAASHTRQVKFLSVQNADTVPATLTVQYNDNATKRTIVKVTLAVGDNLVYAQ
jgi:hypothetical protein